MCVCVCVYKYRCVYICVCIFKKMGGHQTLQQVCHESRLSEQENKFETKKAQRKSEQSLLSHS